MPTLKITLDGVDLKEIPLNKTRTTLGRRPYNDIVVDNLAVSGEHAVFVRHPDGVEIQDLHSTNGTYLNGKAVVSARVGRDDLLEIGRYHMRVLPDPADGALTEASQAPVTAAAVMPPATAPSPTPAAATATAARIQVLNGPAAGKTMTLTKVVTTLGKPGVAVAAINHRSDSYTLTHVDGTPARVNGRALEGAPVALHPGDQIELAGTQMRFELD